MWTCKKGETLISTNGHNEFVKYLGECAFNEDCFIGENDDGDVFDDYIKSEFKLYDGD